MVQRMTQRSLLTIAIPTFNRALKLKRLLNILMDEISVYHLESCVQVLVSDNASADQTPAVVSEFLRTGFGLNYHRQSQNLGFDGNLRFLYTHSESQYIWFMADDDFPLPGAINRLVVALREYDPDVLLSSFVQPPGSTERQFDFPEPVHLVSDPVCVIKHVLNCGKLSAYVICKVDLDASKWRELDENLGAGWYFMPLAFSVLEASPSLRLVIVSEPLATCDEDYMRLPWVPLACLSMHKSCQHSFVLKHCPSLVERYLDEGYYQAIHFAFAAKTGLLLPEHPEEYDEFIRELKCRVPTLLKSPRVLVKFIALKLRIAGLFAGLWPRAKTAISWATTFIGPRRD